MTDESFAHLPETATIDVGALLRRLSALQEAARVDSLMIVEAQARVAEREKETLTLRMVLSMIDGGIPATGSPITPGEVVPFPHARSGSPKLTHKYMTLRVLADSERGLRTADVIRLAGERFGETIDKTSLSPLMAKLREARLVAHDKDRSEWNVTETGRDHLGELEAAAR